MSLQEPRRGELNVIDGELAGAVMPYGVAAAGAYGVAVVERVRDAAADATANATVGVGRRLLRRILHRETVGPIGQAVRDLAVDPADPDRVAAMRLQIRKELAADPELAAEVTQILERAGVTVTATGYGAVAVQDNRGIVQTGMHSRAWQA